MTQRDEHLQARDRPQKKPTLTRPWSWTSSLQDYEKINLLFKSPVWGTWLWQLQQGNTGVEGKAPRLGSDGRADRPGLPLPLPRNRPPSTSVHRCKRRCPWPRALPWGCWETGPCILSRPLLLRGVFLTSTRRGTVCTSEGSSELPTVSPVANWPPEHSIVIGLKDDSPLPPQTFPLKSHPHRAFASHAPVTHSVTMNRDSPGQSFRHVGKRIPVLRLFPAIPIKTNDEF